MLLRTISPNLEKQTGYKRIRHLLEKGILPCIGHDADCSEDAILDCLQIANEFGKRLHITHLFNASTFHHRNMKLCNFGMLRDFPKLKEYEGLRPPTVEIIGDFVHVHPLALKLTIDSKGMYFYLIRWFTIIVS
jgi:N-acetylglucosamine-6-phosphate deacetylase